MTTLRRHRLFESGGITLDEVTCRHRPGRGQSIESSTGHALVFVRRGCFIRSADGREALLDPTVAFCSNPGEELRYDHPHLHGDDCTAVGLEPALVASLWGGRPTLPAGALPSSPQIDLEHRLLLSAARSHAEPAELMERSIALAARALERVDPRPIQSGRPSTAGARRALADGAREALAADPGISLRQLARQLAVSPHHLSRVFRYQTGHTLSRHRMRLRARQALERMARGHHDLAQLASDLGFVDQSHFCRVIRSETGYPPGSLRQHL